MFKVNGIILDRSKPLELTCVKCLAAPGDPCTGVVSRGAKVRASNHVERWQDFVQLERDRGAEVEYTRTKAPAKPSRQPAQPQNAPRPAPKPPVSATQSRVRVEREAYPRGFDRFMASERWFKTRAAAFAKHGRVCRACKSVERVEVYHRTFERFMREYAQDLVPFCDGCWARVDALADDGYTVAAAMSMVCKRTKAGKPAA